MIFDSSSRGPQRSVCVNHSTNGRPTNLINELMAQCYVNIEPANVSHEHFTILIAIFTDTRALIHKLD